MVGLGLTSSGTIVLIGVVLHDKIETTAVVALNALDKQAFGYSIENGVLGWL